MKQVCRILLVPTAILVLITVDLAWAKNMPTLHFRELIFRAQVVVLVEPIDPLQPEKDGDRSKQREKPVRFKVMQVLKGSRISTTDTIQVKEVFSYRLSKPPWAFAPGKKPTPPEIEKGVLFLNPESGSEQEQSFRPVISGIRYLTKDKKVLRPEQFSNPGSYYMVPVEGADWDKMLEEIRAEVIGVSDVMALKKIKDPANRNAAIFGWIEAHRNEFTCDQYFDERINGGKGWGSLEKEPFTWIMESCIPADCWRAVKLYAELNPLTDERIKLNQFRVGPSTSVRSFSSVEGRKLLLEVALDTRQPVGDRWRALTWLSSSFWPYLRKELPQLTHMSKEEQSAIIEKLIPLLSTEETMLREVVVEAIHNASFVAPMTSDKFTKQALSALVAAYESEPPGKVRDNLAKAVCAIGAEENWRELTGNPHAILVLLKNLYLREGMVTFYLDMIEGSEAVYENPTLILENLDTGLVSKQTPLPVCHAHKSWKEGWYRKYRSVAVSFSYTELTPGKWRVTVEGTAGKGENMVRWTSEPKTFVVPKAQEEQQQTLEGAPPGTTEERESQWPEPGPKTETRKAPAKVQSELVVKKKPAAEEKVTESQGANWLLPCLIIVACVAIGILVLTVTRRKRRG